MLDPAKEITIREALGAKIANLTGSVFVRRPVIDSKQDWTELLGVENVDQEYELRVCTVDLLSFTDSGEYGCDDDPMVTLTYKVHLFFQYKEARSDGSNSTDDFTAVVLNLRNSFLDRDRQLYVPGGHTPSPIMGVETLPLAQSGFILLGEDPFTGSYGHYVDLLSKVEVN